ncbi:hypothetical protein FACS1894182_05340 [Bacteroidia bacterium]|nr:hypothetical protein FACS1894182_05340 [Bacteroidia bacterium]
MQNDLTDTQMNVRKVDSHCIYVMKNGYIVESGTHDEIYHMNGTY